MASQWLKNEMNERERDWIQEMISYLVSGCIEQIITLPAIICFSSCLDADDDDDQGTCFITLFGCCFCLDSEKTQLIAVYTTTRRRWWWRRKYWTYSLSRSQPLNYGNDVVVESDIGE